jgi:exosortase F-associated protein
MQKNKQIDTMQLGVLLLLVLALVSIRIFENSLFYDPLIAYYKGMHQIKLFTSLGFRFYLNSILSLGIIHLLFKNPTSTKFALLLYLVLGSVLLISFVFMLEFFGETNKMTLFYIRRFIIQPLFLILFVPAFYYQNKMQNNK